MKLVYIIRIQLEEIDDDGEQEGETIEDSVVAEFDSESQALELFNELAHQAGLSR